MVCQRNIRSHVLPIFAEVISTSMRQLLPHEGHLCGIANPVFIRKSFNIPTGIMAKMGKGIITISSHRDGQSLLCRSY